MHPDRVGLSRCVCEGCYALRDTRSDLPPFLPFVPSSHPYFQFQYRTDHGNHKGTSHSVGQWSRCGWNAWSRRLTPTFALHRSSPSRSVPPLFQLLSPSLPRTPFGSSTLPFPGNVPQGVQVGSRRRWRYVPALLIHQPPPLARRERRGSTRQNLLLTSPSLLRVLSGVGKSALSALRLLVLSRLAIVLLEGSNSED